MTRFFPVLIILLAVGAPASAQLTVVSGATFNPDRILAPGSIASGFGEGLAPAIEAATTTPLPTSLQGVRVTVTDLALQTMDCPLIFVSPGQINFVLPAGLAEGPATVRVRPAAALSEEGPQGTVIQEGTIQIARVAPGLFNQTEDEWAAAFLLRARADGTQTRESIYHAPDGLNIVPRVLELSPGGDETDELFLELFGTGFRNAGFATDVTSLVGLVGSASLGERDVIPTLFAGRAPGFEGLDQTSIGPLDRRIEFFGGGDIPIALLAAGQASNVVWMRVAPNPDAPVITKPNFAVIPGSPPSVRYAFDFADADGDFGPFRFVASWEDSQRICTKGTIFPATAAGQTSGRIQQDLRKPTGAGIALGPIQRVAFTVSDQAGHISSFVEWTPTPPGSMPGFTETCDAVLAR